MRYIVKVAKDQDIKNAYHTNNYSEALAVRNQMREKYGRDNVWICDLVTEILVG